MSASGSPDPQPWALVQRLAAACGVEPVPFDQLKREIYQYGKRRCDREGSVDNLKYYLGFAFEINEGLDIFGVALTGLLSMSPFEVLRLFPSASNLPSTMLDLIRRALDDPAIKEAAIAKGIRLQWERSAAAYQAEVSDFMASDAFHRKGWRKKPITRRQAYLIGEIRRLLGVEPIGVVNRGQAFEFIRENGGNPRFQQEPKFPRAEAGACDA